MLQARFGGALGQAFTSAPVDFEGSLADVLALDTAHDPQAGGMLVATLNAVLRAVGDIGNTVHCRDDGPEQCAERYAALVRERFGTPRIALVGFQPALLARLAKEFDVRVLDLNPEIVGTVRSGVLVEDGMSAYQGVVRDWAELVLCTGSTLCNGSFVNFLDIGKPVLFFGTSCAGAARILGAERFCPMSA